VQPAEQPRDLVVLVADKNMQAAVAGILNAPERLRTRNVGFDGPYVHRGKDPGVYRFSHEFLRPFQRRATHALVLFDREGCGSTQTRAQLELEVETRLSQNGWRDRAATVVIDPELENWVWSDSPQVEAALGWPGGQLRTWLMNQGTWRVGADKPNDPKDAVDQALRHVRKPRTSDIYLRIAEQVSFERCSDPAFGKLKTVLRHWFPA
jgi:hypothetical protein